MLSHPLLKELSAEIYKGENTQLICNLVINAAAVMKASDIHVEPLSGFVRIRYRID
ncbi:hypothetical protein KC711_02820 [Candidatus Peregrinibacteria bacterium]|jgi:type II secretory ATPase GspE/PulE/Tfp pilus assembly ATPase PilB-like protein|nr:hypothetical protein [Candidatus Peregrinibacteria bacterium]